MRRWLLIALTPLLHAQGIIAPTAFVPQASSGTSVTVELGGTAANYSDLENGNSGLAEATPFITPTPSSGSVAVNSLGVFVDTPDSSATTGLSIYNANVSTLTAATVCTGTNTPTTGCLAGSVLYAGTIAGTSGAYAAGQEIYISSFTHAGNNGYFPVGAYNSAYLTLTNSGGTTETHAGQAVGVGSLACGGKFSATPTNDVFNTIPEASLTQGSACSTLSAGTQYFAVQVTSSATQNQGTSGQATCPFVGGQHSIFALSSTVSASTWPTNITFNDSGVGLGDGCYAAYASLTYTTTAAFTIIQAGGAWTTTQTTNTFTIAPLQSGHNLMAATHASTNAAPITGVVDKTSGTTHDTLTLRGGGGTDAAGYQNGIWTVDGATSGVNTISATVTQGAAGWHNNVEYMEILGPNTGGSFDKSGYDTVDLTSVPFTSAVQTGTTTHATELLIGGAISEQDCTGLPCQFTGTSGWTAVQTVMNPGTGFNFATGLFYQNVASTGAYGLSGTFNENVTGYNILPGLITLHQ
jgi:hypothetical protein